MRKPYAKYVTTVLIIKLFILAFRVHSVDTQRLSLFEDMRKMVAREKFIDNEVVITETPTNFEAKTNRTPKIASKSWKIDHTRRSILKNMMELAKEIHFSL